MTNQIYEYKIIVGTYTDVEKRVNNYIKQGYVLNGVLQPYTSPTSSDQTLFAQGIILEKD